MQHEKDVDIRQLAVNRLEAVRKAYSYESVPLRSANGATLLALGEQGKLPAVTQALLSVALQTGRLQSSDLFLDESGHPLLDVLVPLTAKAISEQPVAAVILRANLEQFLVPLIEKWPGNSPSAEILLIRQAGGTMSHLNGLRHLGNAGTNNPSRRPIVSDNIVRALAGKQRGVAQGTDYRGETVFITYRPIEGSEWRLLAKIDRDEVFAPIVDPGFLGQPGNPGGHRRGKHGSAAVMAKTARSPAIGLYGPYRRAGQAPQIFL